MRNLFSESAQIIRKKTVDSAQQLNRFGSLWFLAYFGLLVNEYAFRVGLKKVILKSKT